MIPERVRAPDPPQRAPRSDEESADILLKDINALCQQLITNHSNPDLQALKSVRYSLRAAIASANGSRPLPEKDIFPPNQKTWAETAERMGARKAPKAPKRNHGPVAGNTEKCIGAVKGKRSRKYSDPHAGGERSGKRAKPDALSATANESARAMPPPTRAAVLAPARASPSAAAAGSATHFFTCGNLSAAVPLAYLSSSAAPVDTFSLLSAAKPGRGFAPLSAAGLGFGQGGTTPEKHFRLS